MARQVTHKDIAEYLASQGRPVSVERVSQWGRQGRLGSFTRTGRAKQYPWGQVKRKLGELTDARVKLTKAQCAEIREQHGVGWSVGTLANEYNVHPSTITGIVSHRRRTETDQ